jgi:drug/metabolite transporter (DMT)-like permease
MYFEASKSIGTGLAMVIFFTYPIFVVGWSWFLKKIIPTRSVFVALILIIIGCALIAYGNRDSSDVASALNIRGLALACASGLCYGTYVFYSKELTTLVSPILATFCVCLGTAFSFAIYIFLSSQTIVIPGTNYILTLLVLFAVVGTILPVFLLLAGIIYIPASTASIVSVLEPVAVLAVGALILDEPLQRIQLVGTLVILSATLLVATKKKAI